MSLKHSLKAAARETFARIVWHTGLHRVFDALGEPRLLILYGHCVDQPATNAVLDADMKIDGVRLAAILRALGKRYDLVTVGEGAGRLRGQAGSEGKGRSMVALSMDDGYHDNLHELVPLLKSVGARATVFLEGGAVGERRLPWLHALGWLQRTVGPASTAKELAETLGDQADDLRAAALDPNRQKRILKYDADPGRRDAALLDLVRAHGGDARAIVDELYMGADDAAALAQAGPVEVGGHTLNHPVLGRLSRAEQEQEISRGRDALRGTLQGEGEVSFAYPYGRRWDVNDDSPAAVRAAGYQVAVTTHAGVGRASTDPFLMPRWPIHNGTRMHLVGTEACGAFDWLRRLGIDLVE